MSAFVRLQRMTEIPTLERLAFWELFSREKHWSKHKAQAPKIEQATQYALQSLEQDLPAYLTYHSFWHTWYGVLPAVERLAMMEGLPENQRLLARTAALYHDIGFVEQSQNHETVSARIAGEILPRFGYTTYQVQSIQSMIMATKLPQSPKTLLEQIVADADLDVLGREDFWARNQALRSELAVSCKPVTDSQWYANQLKFLQSHSYFTASAQKLRNVQKQRNIALLKEHLATVSIPISSKATT